MADIVGSSRRIPGHQAARDASKPRDVTKLSGHRGGCERRVKALPGSVDGSEKLTVHSQEVTVISQEWLLRRAGAGGMTTDAVSFATKSRNEVTGSGCVVSKPASVARDSRITARKAGRVATESRSVVTEAGSEARESRSVVTEAGSEARVSDERHPSRGVPHGSLTVIRESHGMQSRSDGVIRESQGVQRRSHGVLSPRLGVRRQILGV